MANDHGHNGEMDRRFFEEKFGTIKEHLGSLREQMGYVIARQDATSEKIGALSQGQEALAAGVKTLTANYALIMSEVGNAMHRVDKLEAHCENRSKSSDRHYITVKETLNKFETKLERVHNDEITGVHSLKEIEAQHKIEVAKTATAWRAATVIGALVLGACSVGKIIWDIVR